MHFINVFSIEEPIRVVVITTTTDIVWMNSMFGDYICKDSANAITPEFIENATSNHSRVPTDFELFRLQGKLLFWNFVNTRQQIYYNPSNNGKSWNQEKRKSKSGPLTRYTENWCPKVRIDKRLCHVSNCLESQASSPLRLNRNVHIRISPHDNWACKEGNNTRKATNFTEQVSRIPCQQYQTSFLDGWPDEWLIDFE